VKLVPEKLRVENQTQWRARGSTKLGTEPKKKHPQAESEGMQIAMVAGARNRRYLHLNYVVI